MRFFTDQFFTEQQKIEMGAAAGASVPKVNLRPDSRLSLHEFAAGASGGHTLKQHLAEQVISQRESEVKYFERKSRRIGLTFLGGTLSFTLAVALVDLLLRSSIISI